MSRDTIYYECLDELSFDTIPYMVKDQAFLDGLNELQLMLNGKIPYSLKRAEFIVERAYSGGNMNYEKFCHNIDSIAYILKRFIEVNNNADYIYGRQWNVMRRLGYDYLESPTGTVFR